MNPTDRQLGRLNFVLRDATAKSGSEPEDRAIWEMLDVTMAQEVAVNKLKQDQTVLQKHWLRCTQLQSSHECHQL